MARAVSLPISEDLAERLRAEGEASDLPPPVLAASLIDEMIAERDQAIALGQAAQFAKPQRATALPA